jgi:hypothetical protein
LNFAVAVSNFLSYSNIKQESRNSSVGIATCYGLEDQGSIAGRSKIVFFFTDIGWALGPTRHPIKWVIEVTSFGVKRPEQEADHTSPFSAEERRVELPPLPHISSWRSKRFKQLNIYLVLKIQITVQDNTIYKMKSV